MTVLKAGGKEASETVKREILLVVAAAVMSAGVAVAPGRGIVTARALASSSADQPSASDDWESYKESNAPAHSNNHALDTPEANHRKYFNHLKEELDKSQRKNREIFENVERNIRAHPPSKPWNPFPPAAGTSH
jgi:hypothetical protein